MGADHHLGTVRAITTEVGAIAETRDFDAFGKPLAAAVVDQPYGFTGREYDTESSLYFYRARYYDPATGRFLQEDPLGFDAGDLNLYRYTWNDPLHWTDPTGLTAAIESGGLAQFGETNGQAVGGGVAEGVNCILNGVAGALAATNSGASVQGIDLGKCAAQAAAGALLGAARLGPVGRGSRGNKGSSGPQKNRGSCSFDGSTLVLTEDGYEPIRDLIAYEDRVWSRDEETGAAGWKTVEGRFSSYHDAVVIVTVRDIETGAEQVIRTTETHPFYVDRKRKPSLHLAAQTSGHSGLSEHWVGAADLTPGDRLVNADRSFAEVVAVRSESQANFKAYNLSVEDFETFFVRGEMNAEPVWVHNSNNCGLGPGPFAKESIPGSFGRLKAAAQRAINSIGNKFGCHTCGTRKPGTRTGDWIGDHIIAQSTARLLGTEPSDILPQCKDCSGRQAGNVTLINRIMRGLVSGRRR